MLYYLGKEGNAFKKEECKKYKTKAVSYTHLTLPTIA